MKCMKLLTSVCCAMLLVVLAASGAQAGYWKFIGVQGIAHQTGGNGLVKADFNRGSLIFKDMSAKGEVLKHLQYTWSGLPDKIYPGKKYILSVEGRTIARTGTWYGGCSDLGVYFRDAFGAGGSSVPDSTVSAETGCGSRQAAIEFSLKAGSPDKSNSFHYGHIQFSMGLVQMTADRYKYVYEWVDDSSPSPSSTPQVSGSSSALSIDGAWSINNQPCQVIQSDDSLTFINENGQRSRGRFIRANAVVAIDWGNLEGRLGAYYKGQRMAATEARDAFGANVSEIKWSNGTVWRRTGNR